MYTEIVSFRCAQLKAIRQSGQEAAKTEPRLRASCPPMTRMNHSVDRKLAPCYSTVFWLRRSPGERNCKTWSQAPGVVWT